MIRYFLMSLTCLLFLSFLKGQDNLTAPSILVHFEGIEDDDNHSIFIIKELQMLTDTATQQKLFKEVLDKTEFEKNLAYLTEFRLLIEGYSSGAPRYVLDSVQKEYRATILDKLIHYEYLLKINVSKNEATYNYKFKLYPVLPGKVATADKPGTLPYPLVNSKRQSDGESVPKFAKKEKRELLLSNKIRQLFPNSNSRPRAIITVNKKSKQNKVYHLALGDSLLVDALNSSDEDTKRANFEYDWEQVDLQGNFNVPTNKVIPLDSNAISQYIHPPVEDDYLLTLKVKDGIIDSKKDSLYLRVINRPKLTLSSNRYAKRNKESIFQYWLNKDTYKRKLQDSFTIKMDSTLNRQFQLNPKVVLQKSRTPLNYTVTTTDSIQYQVYIDSPLKYRDSIALQLEGVYQSVLSEPSYYQFYRPERDFAKINIGTEVFAGPYSLGFPSDSVGIFLPSLTLSGGLYLFHWRTSESALLIEGGLGWFPGKAKQHISHAIAGKISLKLQTYFPDPNPIGIYLAVHVIGHQKRPTVTTPGFDRHYGFGMGIAIKPLNLEVDFINIYHNFKEDGFSLSGGIRWNIGDIFYKKIPALIE